MYTITNLKLKKLQKCMKHSIFKTLPKLPIKKFVQMNFYAQACMDEKPSNPKMVADTILVMVQVQDGGDRWWNQISLLCPVKVTCHWMVINIGFINYITLSFVSRKGKQHVILYLYSKYPPCFKPYYIVKYRFFKILNSRCYLFCAGF